MLIKERVTQLVEDQPGEHAPRDLVAAPLPPHVAAVDLDHLGPVGGDAGNARSQQHTVVPRLEPRHDEEPVHAAQRARQQVPPGRVLAAPRAGIHPVVHAAVAVRTDILELVVAPGERLRTPAPRTPLHRVHEPAAAALAPLVEQEPFGRLERLGARVGVADLAPAPGTEGVTVRHHPATVAALGAGLALRIAPLEPPPAVRAIRPEPLHLVPFQLVGRDAPFGLGQLAEVQLHDWQHLQLRVPHEPDVQLAPLDQLLGDRRLVKLLVDEARPLGEPGVVFHHRGLRDPDRRILEQGLHDQGEPQRRRSHELRARMEYREIRHADAVEGENLLAHRLVARDEQPRRRAPGVLPPVHLQHRGHRVFVLRVPAETLAAVEDELGLERRQLIDERPEVVADPHHQHLVTVLKQRAAYVVLGLFHPRDGHLPFVILIRPLRMDGVEDHGYLHARTLAISRPTVRSAPSVTSPPNTPAAGRTSIAVRIPTRSEMVPIRGGASASPARWENSTKAPSTEARTAAGTTSSTTDASGPLYHV